MFGNETETDVVLCTGEAGIASQPAPTFIGSDRQSGLVNSQHAQGVECELFQKWFGGGSEQVPQEMSVQELLLAKV